MNEIINIIISVLTGLAVCIPLVVKLVEYVRKSVTEKNWGNLLDLTINLMQEAETKFEDGATRKQWVLAMVQSSASTINYEIDIDAVSKMIDELCNMTHIVNGVENKSGD